MLNNLFAKNLVFASQKNAHNNIPVLCVCFSPYTMNQRQIFKIVFKLEIGHKHKWSLLLGNDCNFTVHNEFYSGKPVNVRREASLGYFCDSDYYYYHLIISG